MWLYVGFTVLSLILYYVNVWIFMFVCLCTVAVLAAAESKHRLFSGRAAPQMKPEFFYGNLKSVFRGEEHYAIAMKNIYDANRHLPYVGFYQMYAPALLVTDLELVKNILIRDFSSFYNNNLQISSSDTLYSKNAFVAKDDVWKSSRGHISPMMTSIKIKNLFGCVATVGVNLVRHLNQHCDAQSMTFLDGKEISSIFTTDIMATTIFSANVDSYASETIFRKISRSVVFPAISPRFIALLSMFIPFFSRFDCFSVSTEKTRKLLTALTLQAMKERYESGVISNDFLQQLMNLKKKHNLSDAYITGQIFGFFVDGYETASIISAYALFEFGKNLEIQDRLRREMDEIFEDDSVEYEALMSAPYLEMFTSELLRMHPILLTADKLCTKPYKFSAASPEHRPLSVEPSMAVVIPTYALHMDDRYYPNPEQFNPDNFTPEAIAARPKYAYLPFGDGPRSCYGFRLGLLELKYFIAIVVKNFEVRTSPDCLKDGYKIKPKYPLKTPATKLLICFSKRNSIINK